MTRAAPTTGSHTRRFVAAITAFLDLHASREIDVWAAELLELDDEELVALHQRIASFAWDWGNHAEHVKECHSCATYEAALAATSAEFERRGLTAPPRETPRGRLQALMEEVREGPSTR